MNVIRGVGSYLPDKRITNDDLAATLETSHAWIFERTGIAQRHQAAPDQMTSDLAVEAAKAALQDAGLEPHDIDLVILATATPDHTFPATATRVQHKLGMTRGLAFDVGAVCSGFLVALATADAYLSQGLAQRALVIGAETLTRILDWEDRGTAVLFGDGAGAVVLEADPQEHHRGILGHVLHTDGAGYDLLSVTGGPSSSRSVGTIQMNGREVYKHAVVRLGQVVGEVLDKCQMSASDVDWLIPHQANVRIIDAVLARLGQTRERAIVTIDQHANTSSASIPLALDVGIRSQRIHKGQTLLLEAFAAGFVWGATLVRL